MVIPPISCDLACTGLMMRPAANTPSSRGTRTSPVSASTRTSANWAPKAYLARLAAGCQRADVRRGVGVRAEAARRHGPVPGPDLVAQRLGRP